MRSSVTDLIAQTADHLHARFEAADDLGIQTVPSTNLDMTEVCATIVLDEGRPALAIAKEGGKRRLQRVAVFPEHHRTSTR